MAAPSLTYTLINGTTASASEVMQNFNDLLNGYTDGTKDLSISALTCAGTATLNGNTTIGNATSDTLTVTASLASSIIPSSDGAVDIGSATYGLRALYLGDGDGTTVKIVPAALSADRIYTLPEVSADASFVMTQGTQTIAGTKTFSGQLIGMGTATNDSAAAGYIGEFKQNKRTSATPAITTTTYVSIDTGNVVENDSGETGISLTAGDWDISGTAKFTTTGSVSITSLILFIGTAKNNSSTGLDENENYFESQLPFTSGGEQTAMTPTWRVSISSTTTYYLKCRVIHSGGTSVTATGSIRARRVR
jgi:hypothetical protein